jgi:hypothetical protein
MNIQSTFINQTITVPGTLQHGVYRAYLVSDKKEMDVITDIGVSKSMLL